MRSTLEVKGSTQEVFNALEAGLALKGYMGNHTDARLWMRPPYEYDGVFQMLGLTDAPQVQFVIIPNSNPRATKLVCEVKNDKKSKVAADVAEVVEEYLEEV